ncbi:ATP-binding protein [Methylocaldum sp. BRCS4]|uniref:ATP-binding protein n=1 Tax=Methylocaldum sp. 14B TaxID=1912213 RepID=UPI00098A34F7|nr:ATP-binding protein [Methylocaldum sp. 14B]MVF23129.1 ATP-binding protein [Methylocaldum sp. BRCS4]
MPLNERVRIARRFLRSVRIDSDLGEAAALDGFICPQSSAEVLMTLARHVSETGQGAFTWTGPYGSGKSSLVIALSALLNGNTELQERAVRVFGQKLTKTIWDALPTGTEGWHVVPVVGRRHAPVEVIGEAVQRAGIVHCVPHGGWNESNLIAALTEAVASQTGTHGGLILFIDEMGKFLEAAAQDGSDIYVFQELAEVASRSKGRLLVIGILHQAFEEYAHRLSHEARDEWAKIQGRFIDLVVNTAGEEQIDLISRAIESDHHPKEPGKLSSTIAAFARRERMNDAARLAAMLESCWPLHPVVAYLLGPISRRRFGQNQRSIFGFLNSSEPYGFQDFLNHANDDELYGPDRLWDYLRANLEPSILASPDGHRWALAAEALERCESIGGDALHIKLLKTIAVIDLFKERSGLVANFELLCACLPRSSPKDIRTALSDLDKWSFTIFKKFLDAHAIFAGSDFDIDQAVRTALEEIDEIDFKLLKSLAGLQPVLAKRHYHKTGALRWFEVNIVPSSGVIDFAAHYKPENGAIGQFLLIIPTEGESEERAQDLCRKAARYSKNGSHKWDIVVGISKRSWAIVPLARELFALENVSNNHAELAGDPVARREVSARLAEMQALLEMELHKAFDTALWFRKNYPPKPLRSAELNGIASELADHRFDQCPQLHNELLNRQKPSSNAIGAQNILLRRMVLNEGEPRLGIDGFPAEGGLFASILESTRLYIHTATGWRFTAPGQGEADPCRLAPLWEAALDHIKENAGRTIAVSELFDLWHRPPFGVKDGLMPVLAVAFILSQRNKLAVYREGIFRARFDDVDVEYLAMDAAAIQLRWMDLSDVSRRLLSGMAEIVRDLDSTNALVHLEPIDVARGLVAIYDQLPAWTKRTMRLSANAVRVRDLFKRAKDPNKFLFDDIPGTLGEDVANLNEEALRRIVGGVREGLEELVHAYPSMLHRLRDIMLSELQVPNVSPQSLAELRDRAENIRQLAGDFRLEAFVGRLSQFDGSVESFEGIASLAANKPPRDWVDPDLDKSGIEIADIAQKFIRAETYARVKGRPEKRQAMAVVIGMDGRPAPLLEEFDVADTDRATVNDLIERVTAALEEADTSRRSVILAALAELSARYMQTALPAGKDGKGRTAS